MLSVTVLRRLTALSLTLLCACARTTDSTETGNPPVIDVELIALVEKSGEVHVVGEPKAIRPGGGRLEVTTVASGDVARGDVGEDGSFDVAVDGTLDDQYRLRAIGAKASSEPVYFDRGGVIDAPDAGAAGAGGAADAAAGDAGDLSCEDLGVQIQDRFAQVEADFAGTCLSNADCGETRAAAHCPIYCHGVALAYEWLPMSASVIDSIGSSLCEPFAAKGECPLINADCTLSPPIACVESQCTLCEGASCPETSCDTCNTPLLTWSTRGGASGLTFMLEDCRTLTATPAGDQPACSRTLPCVRNTSDFDYTTVHVQNALGHPDVQAALVAGTNFGAITPGGFGFSLSVGDESIFVSATGCDVSAVPCNEEPEGVASLRFLLENIAIPCDVATSLAPECSLAFDPGTGSASEQAYAFNAAIGTCVPEIYSGEGGNANRYDTINDCRTFCPTTAAAGCPSDRVFVEEACLQCGLTGGCPATGPICGRPCTDASDCQDEFGTCGPDGVCAASGCI